MIRCNTGPMEIGPGEAAGAQPQKWHSDLSFRMCVFTGQLPGSSIDKG